MLIDGATVDLEQENQRLQAELRAQTQELRELARGIHPVVLTQRGLEPALRSLANVVKHAGASLDAGSGLRGA